MLMTLIAFLGFGLRGALEEPPRKRGEFMALCSSSPSQSPSSVVARLAVSLVPLSERGGSAFLLLLSRVPQHPLSAPSPCPPSWSLISCSSFKPYQWALPHRVPDSYAHPSMLHAGLLTHHGHLSQSAFKSFIHCLQQLLLLLLLTFVCYVFL